MENTFQKNMESFEMVYNRFYRRVYTFFAKRLSGKEICEDLTSDVFYSCFKGFENYDPSKASMETWIYSVANNKLKNYYRDKKDSFSIEDDVVFNKLFEKTDLENAIYLTQMNIYLSAAMETVSERERAIISFRFFSDLTSEEIAEKVGLSAGNVRVILTRTIKKLSKYFENKGIRWE